MMRREICGAALLVCSVAGHAAVEGREFRYVVGDQVHVGYLARDVAAGEPRPAAIVVHEWWGHNDYARKRADMLAEQGYVAFALDMYGDGRSTDHPKQAGEFMNAARAKTGAIRKRFETALRLIRSHPAVDGQPTVAIGYCFGGAVVLGMARAGLDLAGVVSFHGSLAPEKPTEPGAIKAEVLVFNGEADPFVPAEQIASFHADMTTARAKFRYVGYPGVKHSFTNPGATAVGEKFDLPLVYDAEADADSWAQTLAFLERILGR